jgi:hypothetical protein
VRTHREPLTAFVLETASRNFNRRAAVEIPITKGVRTDWREIGHANISQIDFRDLHRQELTVSFPEERSENYRLVIQNADNPSLTISKVRAEGNAYRVLFLANPEGRYRLYYGSEVPQAPRYDTAAVSEALGRGYQAVVARLSEQMENPVSTEPPAIRFRGWLNNPILLGVSICLLVVGLAWALFRTARRVDQAPQNPTT